MSEVRSLTVPQIAERLACSRKTVRMLIATGELPAFRVGRRSWRVTADDLAAWVRQQQAAARAGSRRARLVRGGENEWPAFLRVGRERG